VHFLVRCLRYRFRTEKLPLKTLMSLDLDGAAVIDVGANKGIYCFWLSRAVGQSGKVLAFEPQPEMIRYIRSRKQCFAFDNIETIETALSDHRGVAQLTRQRVGDGSASLQVERKKSGNEAIGVPLARLDDFEISDLKFIKCDVEGHELNVFTGARRLIETFRPVVQFESLPSEADRLFSFFEELGYPARCFSEIGIFPIWKVGAFRIQNSASAVIGISSSSRRSRSDQRSRSNFIAASSRRWRRQPGSTPDRMS